MMRRFHHSRSGFTLVEVLLAMVISMGVLAAIVFLYYSISIAWISHKAGDINLQHNHSILGFLEDELSLKQRLPSMNIKQLDEQLSWARLPEAGIYDPTYLSWVDETPPPFLQTSEWYGNMAVRLYLKYDARSGLSLIWHPEDPMIERMDITNYDVEDYLFEFPLSDQVIGCTFAYYDAEKDEWEEVENGRNFDPQDRGIPDAVTLTIEDRETVTRTIYLSGKEHSDE